MREKPMWWYMPQKVWSPQCNDPRFLDPITQKPLYTYYSNGVFVNTFRAALRIALKIGKDNNAEIRCYEFKRGRSYSFTGRYWTVKGNY